MLKDYVKELVPRKQAQQIQAQAQQRALVEAHKSAGKQVPKGCKCWGLGWGRWGRMERRMWRLR